MVNIAGISVYPLGNMEVLGYICALRYNDIFCNIVMSDRDKDKSFSKVESSLTEQNASISNSKGIEHKRPSKLMEERFKQLDVMLESSDMPMSSLDMDKGATSNKVPKESKSKQENIFDEIASFTNDIPRIELQHSTGSSILSIPEAGEQKRKPLHSNIKTTSQPVEVVECNETICHISEVWSSTPCGIIECQVPHIGATYLEMHSDRDSIIVFPDNEAYKTSEKYPNCLYVSEKRTEEDISDYIQKQSRHKFIVTPKFIGKLLSQLCKDGQEEECLKYFLMVKDMEQLQAESTYRAENANILDLYLKFPKDKRAIYTTDHEAFTNPDLKDETVHIIKWKNLPKRNIKVMPSTNIIGTLKRCIEKLPANEKILVVYTSIQQARLAILNLKEDIQKECCIWGKDFNKDEAGEEFFISIGESGFLPKRITFLGSRDSTLQVKDKCHLITVSDTSKGSTLMSIKGIVKTYDLCKPTHILSDTVIHNEAACYSQWMDEINTLVERAGKIVKLMNTADELGKGDASLKRLFSIVSTTLRNQATGRIRGRLPNIRLIRKDSEDRHSVAYMNIDSLLLRVSLYRTYYSKPTALGKALKALYDITSSRPNKDKEIPEAQQDIEKKEKKRQSDKKRQERTAILDEILELHKEGKLNSKRLDKECKKGNSLHRKVYQEVARLYLYIGIEELIDCLKHIDSGNRIGFNNFNNKVIYWSLVDDHPLRLSVNEAFKVGGKYTNTEIREKMNSIIQYHFHRDWSENARKPVTLFKCFFETERPKREYIIQSEIDFKQHRERINKEEDDLFIISDTPANRKSEKPQTGESLLPLGEK